MDEFDKGQEEQEWRSDRHKDKRKIRPKHIIILIGFLFIFMLIVYTIILYGGKLIVDEEKLVINGPTTIETVDGDVIWSLYDEYRIPVSLDDIPDKVKNAFIAIEDRRFYDHSGVDYRSIMRAVYKDIIARSKVEGASTITQQLAKNLFLTNDKSWLRKTKEVMVALYLERELSKDEILELYLNAIYFGQGQYGVEAASQKYFSKTVGDLSLEESALLAGMVKAPNGYSPIDHPEKALKRRNVVLDAMYQMGLISEEEKDEAKERQVNLNVSIRQTDAAVHSFVDLVLKEAEDKYNLTNEQLRAKRYKLVVTMEPEFQKIAYEAFKDLNYFPGNNKEDVEGAFVMMDEATGGLVAALGGRNFEISHLNRVHVNRQPGSTMKPIAVFAPALMSENYNPYSLIPDQLLEWEEGTFRNVNNDYDDVVSFYDALVRSKNSPSVWLLNEVGVKDSKSYLEKMNINIEDEGLAIALGGLKTGITPINLVESYRTFAHDGKFTESYTIEEVYDQHDQLIAQHSEEEVDVFSKQVAWTMTEMLQGVVERGTATSGHYKKQLAGKTGTTEHPLAQGFAKDAWFVGYTPQYVTAMWMGYDKSTEENYLTGGSSYPTELTKKILTLIDEKTRLTAEFIKPNDVQAVARPIELPQITDLRASTSFGGVTLMKGSLTWSASADERIIYRIYKVKNGIDERIGEMTGRGSFELTQVNLFKKESYYVVPYDPLTKLEGQQSNIISL